MLPVYQLEWAKWNSKSQQIPLVYFKKKNIKTLEYLPYHIQDLQVLMKMLTTGYILIH